MEQPTPPQRPRIRKDAEPSKEKKGSRRTLLIAAIAAAVVVAGLMTWGALVLFGVGDKSKEVERLCIEDVQNQLRDPNSAEFFDLNEVKQLDDEEFYTFEGKGRARNGFGGMNDFGFSCAVVYTDGEPEITSFTY